MQQGIGYSLVQATHKPNLSDRPLDLAHQLVRRHRQLQGGAVHAGAALDSAAPLASELGAAAPSVFMAIVACPALCSAVL